MYFLLFYSPTNSTCAINGGGDEVMVGFGSLRKKKTTFFYANEMYVTIEYGIHPSYITILDPSLSLYLSKEPGDAVAGSTRS